MYAAVQNSVELIDVLFAAKTSHVGSHVDPDARDRDGDTALHHAVLEGNTAAIRRLLEQGANPHVFNGMGYTPLHLAAINGKVCCLLL